MTADGEAQALSADEGEREARWRAFVAAYDIEVSEERVENELAYIKLDMAHRMQYAQLTGEESHPFPQAELAEREEELRELALHEAKAELVLRELVEKLALDVSADELEAEAKAIAERQNTTVDALRQFFGDDLSMLRRDLLERKVRNWAVTQA